MMEFAYTNTKNRSISHKRFELNCKDHPCVSFGDHADFYSRSCLVEELVEKLKNMMSSKTYSILKNYKNKYTTRELSCKVMDQ